MFNKSLLNNLIIGLGIATILYNIGSVILSPKVHYFDPYYTNEYYKRVENLYNNSQYRQKNPTSIIADEIVFRYSAGAYMRGVDPILVNSEITPLGKYFIGISYILFQSDTEIIVFFGLATLFILWILSGEIMKSNVWSLLPVAFFCSERLFLNQFKVTPLLDIIQLPFILLSIFVFVREKERKIFFWTALSIGFVAATKSVVPAMLLIVCFITYFLIYKQFTKIFSLLIWLSLSVALLMISYTKIFLDGYTFLDFFKFQKWIFLYQQSKLIFPLSFWRLMLFNQWQTWWGNMHITSVNDWNILWPVLVLTPFVGLALFKKLTANEKLVVIWSLLYEAFLSLGITATRFFLPLLPFLYVLFFFMVQKAIKRIRIPI